jgi:hypothetical protein
MQLIGYKAYQRGFFGCLAGRDRYVYFLASRGRFVEIKSYPKDDFEDFPHFVTMLQKFVPRRFFLRRPLPLPSMDAEGLASVGRVLERLSPAEGFLGLRDPLVDPFPRKRC